jgi:hypothetical protein
MALSAGGNLGGEFLRINVQILCLNKGLQKENYPRVCWRYMNFLCPNRRFSLTCIAISCCNGYAALCCNWLNSSLSIQLNFSLNDLILIKQDRIMLIRGNFLKAELIAGVQICNYYGPGKTSYSSAGLLCQWVLRSKGSHLNTNERFACGAIRRK